MPLYEYLCDACGHRFEKIQKFSDPLEDKCPVCGGAVHKLISSPAIQFKGSGFCELPDLLAYLLGLGFQVVQEIAALGVSHAYSSPRRGGLSGPRRPD